MINPNSSLLSILTARPWFYDHNLSFIRFRTDGPGEIWYAGEMFATVANEFDWKALNPQALKETVHNSRGRNIRHLAHLSVEITLTERRPRRDEERARILLKTFQDGKYPFTDAAFRPKTFTLRLERGKFPLPFTDDHGGPKYSHDRLYALRLVFDRSPYPPATEWKKPEESDYIWRWQEFVSAENGHYNPWFEGCVVS